MYILQSFPPTYNMVSSDDITAVWASYGIGITGLTVTGVAASLLDTTKTKPFTVTIHATLVPPDEIVVGCDPIA